MQNSISFIFDDYVASAGSPEAAAGALLTALQQAPQDAVKEVVLSKKAYHFYENAALKRNYYITNHEVAVVKHVAIALESLENVRLCGNGGSLIAHGCILPIGIVNCSNVEICDLTIDYEYPTNHQLKVISSDPAAAEMLCQIESKSTAFLRDGKLILVDDNREYEPTWFMPFEADGTMVYGKPDQPLYYPQVPKLSLEDGNMLRITGVNELFQAGQRLVLRDSRRPAPACFQSLNKNVTWNNVHVYFADGMGFLAQRCENITMEHCSCARNPQEAWRYFSCMADATHFCNCKGLIKVNHSLFEHMGDDAINVHGVYLTISEQTDSHTFIAHYRHEQSWGFRWGAPGEKIRLLATDTMEYLPEEWTIAAIVPNDAPTEDGAQSFRITTEEPLPELRGGHFYGVENMTWTADVEFCYNLIRNNRARGSLFSTPGKVLCAYNTFDHVHGTAILVPGDCNAWYESGACGEVIIAHNKFLDVLTAEYQYCNAAISAAAQTPRLDLQQKYYHRKLSICDNYFESFGYPLLYAESVEEVSFLRNTMHRNTNYARWQPAVDAITTLRVKAASIEVPREVEKA